MAVPASVNLLLAFGAAGYGEEVEPHLPVELLTLFPPPQVHVATPGSDCLT